jgi:hypothetical protein
MALSEKARRLLAAVERGEDPVDAFKLACVLMKRESLLLVALRRRRPEIQLPPVPRDTRN